MKQGTKVFICLLCVVLATLITVACIFCIYYPHYKQNQHAAVIEDKPLERGEMRIMSCNLRCANVMDTGKKSWFYRADLIVKNIETEAPAPPRQPYPQDQGLQQRLPGSVRTSG